MLDRKPLPMKSAPAPLRQAPHNPPYSTEPTVPFENGSSTGPQLQTIRPSAQLPTNGTKAKPRSDSVSSADTWNTDGSDSADEVPDYGGLPAALKPETKRLNDASEVNKPAMTNVEVGNSTAAWQETVNKVASPSLGSQNPYHNLQAVPAQAAHGLQLHLASDLAHFPSQEFAALMIDPSSSARQSREPPTSAPPPPPPAVPAPSIPFFSEHDDVGQSSHHSNPWKDDLDREQQRLASNSPPAASRSANSLQAKDNQGAISLIDATEPSPSDNIETFSTQTQPETPRTRAKQTKESYCIKHVRWFDALAQNGRGALRTSPILTQNINGPCPILALVNALSLSSREGEESAVVDALRVREQITLGLLLDAVFEELVRKNEHTGHELPDIGDLYAFLVTLHTGMNVNPAFVRRSAELPGGFEQTKEMELYGAFHIPLVHGWTTPFGSGTYRAFERSAKTFDEALNVQFLEEEFNTKLEAGGLSQEEQQVFEDLTAVKQFLTTYPTQLSDHGLHTVSAWLNPGQVAILFRNDHFCTLYREPTKGMLMMLVTDTGYATHDEIMWESLVDVNGAMAEFFSGDFRPVGSSRQPSVPPTPTSPNALWKTAESKHRRSSSYSAISQRPPFQPSGSRSRSEQEDMDLALALQLQEEEEEAHRRAEAQRQDAHNQSLSRQYLDQQSQESERPPQIPPRRSPRSNGAQAINSSSRTEEGEAPPPSYEQAASDPPFREAGSTPQPPRQGNALGALSALGAQRQQSSFGVSGSQQGPPSYGRRPSTRLRGASYGGSPQVGYAAAGPSARSGEPGDEKCVVQ